MTLSSKSHHRALVLQEEAGLLLRRQEKDPVSSLLYLQAAYAGTISTGNYVRPKGELK